MNNFRPYVPRFSLVNSSVGSIARIKYDLSKPRGYDIGVPLAVYVMLRRIKNWEGDESNLPQGVGGDFISLFEFMRAEHNPEDMPSREDYIFGYLLHNPPLADEHGNQLRGELIRFQTRLDGRLEIQDTTFSDWCKANQLSDVEMHYVFRVKLYLERSH